LKKTGKRGADFKRKKGRGDKKADKRKRGTALTIPGQKNEKKT